MWRFFRWVPGGPGWWVLWGWGHPSAPLGSGPGALCLPWPPSLRPRPLRWPRCCPQGHACPCVLLGVPTNPKFPLNNSCSMSRAFLPCSEGKVGRWITVNRCIAGVMLSHGCAALAFCELRVCFNAEIKRRRAGEPQAAPSAWRCPSRGCPWLRFAHFQRNVSALGANGAFLPSSRDEDKAFLYY